MEHPFHEFPKHLHPGPKVHELKLLLPDIETATLQRVGFPGPVVVHDAATEALARKAGYVDDYQPVEYPKHLNFEKKDEAGKPITVTKVAKDAEEEAAILAGVD